MGKVALSVERSTAYLTSADVISVPSSNLMPCLILYVQVLPSGLASPRPSARSGTSSLLSLPGATLNINSERPYSRAKFQE